MVSGIASEFHLTLAENNVRNTRISDEKNGQNGCAVARVPELP